MAFISPSKLNPVITNGNRKEEENGFIYNKDAGTYQCSAGFLADSINIIKDKRNGRNIRYSYNFSKSKCGDCPYREKCHPRKGRGKNFTVTILSDVHKNQKEFQESKEFKELSKERYKIEAKNSELKNAHGYGRSVGNGLYETKIQGACVIFVTNLKRITTLMNENKKK